MTDLDVLRKEMIAAGDRLLNALQLENEFTCLYSDYPRVEVLEQWQKARRLAERTAEDYHRSATCFFAAVRHTRLSGVDDFGPKCVLDPGGAK